MAKAMQERKKRARNNGKNEMMAVLRYTWDSQMPPLKTATPQDTTSVIAIGNKDRIPQKRA
jgi:hypothetical protein